MNIEVLKDIIKVIKNVEIHNNQLFAEDNIVVNNSEIYYNINNIVYSIIVNNTDSVIFDEVYNEYAVYKDTEEKGSVYLFTVYYEYFTNDYFVRYKKD